MQVQAMQLLLGLLGVSPKKTVGMDGFGAEGPPWRGCHQTRWKFLPMDFGNFHERRLSIFPIMNSLAYIGIHIYIYIYKYIYIYIYPFLNPFLKPFGKTCLQFARVHKFTRLKNCPWASQSRPRSQTTVRKRLMKCPKFIRCPILG
jgi:hypothetical protein